MMEWHPVNLTAACPTQTELNSCSQFGYIFLNFLVQRLGGSREIRQEKKCSEKAVKKLMSCRNEFDFIVVGAGSAGCVVANRLTELPQWKVLLLEAGPEQPDVTLVPGLSTSLLRSSVDWNYTTEPNGVSCLARAGGQCGWPRGKMMGGTSSINTMVYARGNKLDYDEWLVGDPTWRYDEGVLPYYRKMEKNLNEEALDLKYHGTRGPQSISRFPNIDRPSMLLSRIFTELGLPYRDINAEEQVGNFQTQSFSEGGMRVSANNAYIEPIRHKRKNLVVKTEAEVVRILIDDRKTTYGVKYIKNGKMYTAFAKKEVIVSGGAINSPKLLMLSGIGPKEHLEDLNIPVVKDLPVGENLHDHVSFTGLIIALSNETAPLANNSGILKLTKEYTKMKIKRGPLSSTGPFNSLAFFKTDPNLPAPDIQIQTDSRFWREYIKEPVQYEALEVLPTVFYDAVIPRVQNLVPYSRGYILLNASNPDAPPLLYPNYLSDRRDYETIERGVKIILNMENTAAFQESESRFIKEPLPACKHTEWGSNEYIECMTRQYTFALHHQGGTCKMGLESDKTAVVDARLRVLGVQKLRVIDCSIMPKIIRGNTNAPGTVIGEKGSDMIKEDWGIVIDINHYS